MHRKCRWGPPNLAPEPRRTSQTCGATRRSDRLGASSTRAMISGVRSRCRTCATTVSSSLRRRHAAHRAFRVAPADGVGGDVVAIELAGLARVRGRHRVTAGREDQPAQQRRRLRAGAVGASDVYSRRGWRGPCPRWPRSMIASCSPGITHPLVHRLAQVDAVIEDLVDGSPCRSACLAGACRPASSRISWCGRRGAVPAPASSPSRSAGTA